MGKGQQTYRIEKDQGSKRHLLLRQPVSGRSFDPYMQSYLRRISPKAIQKTASEGLTTLLSGLAEYLYLKWGFGYFRILLSDEREHKLLLLLELWVDKEGVECLNTGDTSPHDNSVPDYFEYIQRMHQMSAHQPEKVRDKDGKERSVEYWLQLPVSDGTEPIAFIEMARVESPGVLSQTQLSEIRNFLETTSQHLLAVRQRKEIERLIKEQHGTIEQLRKLSSGKSIELVLDVIESSIAGIEHVSGFMINLLENDDNCFKCERVRLGMDIQGVESIYQQTRYPLLTGTTDGEVFECSHPILIHKGQIEQYSEFLKSTFLMANVEAMVLIPLMHKEEPLGVIKLLCAKWPDVDQINALFTKMDDVVGLLADSMQYEQLKKKQKVLNRARDERNLFLKFTSYLNTISTLHELTDRIADEFLDWYPFDLAGVYLANDGKLELETIRTSNKKYENIRVAAEKFWKETPYLTDHNDGAPVVGYLKDIPIYIADNRKIEHLPMATKDKKAREIYQGLSTILHVPIRHSGKPIGVLSLWSLSEPVNIEPDNITFIEQLCSAVGTSISNSRLFTTVENQRDEIEKLNEQLREKLNTVKELARKDQLTQLYNFGYGSHELTRLCQEYNRITDDEYLSTVIFDIDHFKQVNDKYGHVIGNVAIVEVAGIISRHARSMDLVCRYGGEEFLVVLPRCTIKSVKGFAERIRKEIESKVICAENIEFSLTISGGCTRYRYQESPEEFINRADKALYNAKKRGRNRICTL